MIRGIELLLPRSNLFEISDLTVQDIGFSTEASLMNLSTANDSNGVSKGQGECFYLRCKVSHSLRLISVKRLSKAVCVR